jgi:hypothetical protein
MTPPALPAPALALALALLAAGAPLAPAVPQSAPTDWSALVERDRRLGFGELTGGEALETLARAELSVEQRATALFALGSSGSRGERERLVRWVRQGHPLERRAAVLALGELGPGSTEILVEVARGTEADLAECALLALLRSRQPEGRAYVERVLSGADGALAQVAQDLLTFQRDPLAAPPMTSTRALLELRYEAARAYGLVDGKTWRVLVYEELARDDALLDRLVYDSAPKLKLPGIKDHFLGALQEGSSERAVGAAVAAIPTELAQLVQHGLWVPSGDQWTVLLEAVEKDRVENLCEPLLVQALAVEGLEGWAAFLLVRGGNERGAAVLERSLETAGPQTRRRIAEGLAATADAAWSSRLAKLAEDEDEEVRAAALVAQARLGLAGAAATIELLLIDDQLDGGRVRREILVDALASSSPDPTALELLEDALPELVGRSRMRAATALAEAGRAAGAEIVREQLRARIPGGEEGARLVRALGRNPSVGDLELFRDAFPREGDLELNAALCEVLLEAKTPAVVALLRGALWRAPLHRSFLAAGLMIDSAGVGLLRRELENAPRSARDEDLRRVGFALGLWGGMRQAEELAQRWGLNHPGLQGVVLGVLAARTL